MFDYLALIKSPKRIPELVRKLKYRLIATSERSSADFAQISRLAVKAEDILKDPQINGEAKFIEQELFDKWNQLRFKNKFSGEGDISILYYIIRKLKPETIVETGVAAGFSSETILRAIKLNQKGTLYSSDYPYINLKKPLDYIGVLVENQENWNLFIDGDRENLPRIIKMIDSIDVFHYDSDKSYGGREFAFKLVKEKINKDSLLIFDDITDNNFFLDKFSNSPFTIKIIKRTKYKSQYVGLACQNSKILSDLFPE